jgi:2-polyprenyl-3-methyl-5-hydroxy-6-metoxy-1,4-benzoquinol methylase
MPTAGGWGFALSGRAEHTRTAQVMMTTVTTFDERARDWDIPERRERAQALARVLRASVPLTSSMCAIDIGAGTGLLGLELASDVARIVLAEPSSGMLEVAREKLATGRWPNATAVAFDLVGDPPLEPPFDLAVSLLVLHHVADTKAGLAAIHALLAPLGRLALMDLDAEDGSFHDEDAPGVHHHGFERAEIVRLAREVGFTDLRITTALEIERHGRSYPLFLLTGRRP